MEKPMMRTAEDRQYTPARVGALQLAGQQGLGGLAGSKCPPKKGVTRQADPYPESSGQGPSTSHSGHCLATSECLQVTPAISVTGGRKALEKQMDTI